MSKEFFFLEVCLRLSLSPRRRDGKKERCMMTMAAKQLPYLDEEEERLTEGRSFERQIKKGAILIARLFCSTI